MTKTGLTYSFVLLTYNQAETVSEAVAGALAQNCPAMEIVISDDCSTDATFQIVQEAVASYKGSHRVILNQNERNLGLDRHIERIHELTTGEVIIAAAGDDVSLPHRSALIMATFDAKRPLLVCSLARGIDLAGQGVPINYRAATLYNTADPAKAAQSKALYLGATGAWHRDLFSKYGPMEPGSYEDLVLGFRAALEGKVEVIEEELVIYRIGNGLSGSGAIISDLAGFQASQIRRLVAWKAVLRQRVKDVQTFGLARPSPVWAALDRADIRAKICWAYYHDDLGALLKQIVRNPILVLRTVRSERRRRRKFIRRLH
jgi:glycosyltransferase involved in cell wall biosynthesis